MFSAPGSALLPARERQLFIEQFERDLEFFQLFFLLVNKSCPVPNIDLVWTEHRPADRVRLCHTGIEQALAGPCSRLLKCRRESPHPDFCNLVNGRGAYAAETCGRSDRAAEEEVRRTGKRYVYRCRFGLTDVAVPVMWNGVLAATLYTGQVLEEPHSREGFERVAASVGELAHVDLAALEAAYWKVPVVGAEDIANTASILEAFAAYLANSWTRLAEAVKEQRRREREASVLRKEFAWLALEGGGDRTLLREIMRKLGLTRPPNRVLVVRPEPECGGLEVACAAEAVEEVCEKLGNAASAYWQRREICVFFDDRSGGTGERGTRRLAARILEAAGARCEERVRIGIGTAKPNWRSLPESHKEALLALAGSAARIAWYRRPVPRPEELSKGAARLAAAVAERNFEQAGAVARELCRTAGRRLADNIAAQRVFFSSTLEAVFSAARDLGLECGVLEKLRAGSARELEGALGIAELHEAFARSAAAAIGELRRLYSSRAARTVERVCRIVERALEARETVTMGGVAAELGISRSHFSRTFHRATGQTFERYLAGKRVEMARRMLLDPLAPITWVAEACGFSDANYFARVFRKLCGCSPSEYRENPDRRPARASQESAL